MANAPSFAQDLYTQITLLQDSDSAAWLEAFTPGAGGGEVTLMRVATSETSPQPYQVGYKIGGTILIVGKFTVPAEVGFAGDNLFNPFVAGQPFSTLPLNREGSPHFPVGPSGSSHALMIRAINGLGSGFVAHISAGGKRW